MRQSLSERDPYFGTPKVDPLVHVNQNVYGVDVFASATATPQVEPTVRVLK
jgi:hypothetical protein